MDNQRENEMGHDMKTGVAHGLGLGFRSLGMQVYN